MLIEFSVRNYMSLRDEQTVTFVPTAIKELAEENTFDTEVAGVGRLLKSSAIYGANAAGKSNVLIALMKMRSMVLQSASPDVADREVPVKPFAFDEAASEPTMMQVVFVHNGMRYQYGFECTRDRILEEWLYVYPERRSQVAFKRVFDRATETYEWDLKRPWLRGRKSAWKDATGYRSLFVSVAASNNSDQMATIREWFRDQIVDGDKATVNRTASAVQDADIKKAAIAIFNAADLNISDIRTESFRAIEQDNPLLTALRNALPVDVQKTFDETKTYQVWLKHRVNNDSDTWIPLGDESRGTREFFADLGAIMMALATGSLLIFDELNNNLHPILARAIVKLFHSSKWNPKGAQILFTTHETALLTTDILRRDQVLFAKKDANGASTIYSLTDFETRKEASLEKQYLQGRFGAIPFIPDNAFESILDSPEEEVNG